MNVFKILASGLLICCLLPAALAPVYALTVEEARNLATGETESRIAALTKAVEVADEKVFALIKAMSEDSTKIAADRVLIMQGDKFIDAVTGAVVELPSDAEDVVSNNRLRGELESAIAALKLFSTNVQDRMEAASSLLKEPDPGRLAMLERALAKETDAEVKAKFLLAQAAVRLGSKDAQLRKDAASMLGANHTPETILLLNQRLSEETDALVKSAIEKSIREIEASLKLGENLGALFTGISLGSILLLVALGLAITYGLMGVINMAHGELMMIGAYATYLVQAAFQKYFPHFFDWYLLLALPVAFLASAIVGAILERVVLKHLYGRPLETLLATWGISLILIQAVRTLFGAQNVGVENPSWMSGGIQLLPNLILPYNRLVIIAFAAFVLLAMAALISKTRLGLFVRAVTQNRPIAACMGVNTARIDTMAFALGSGIAGLAGAALSQVGNVGPDLGQGYIVDSFMVVVLGGVGQLAGSVYAALGLGVLNKFLEGIAGAVLAKIMVLVFIVIFIQKRPQGIFALKGRSAEA